MISLQIWKNHHLPLFNHESEWSKLTRSGEISGDLVNGIRTPCMGFHKHLNSRKYDQLLAILSQK